MSQPETDPSEVKREAPAWKRKIAHVRNTLLTGVVVIIPMLLTYFVLKFAYDIITSISAPWLAHFGLRQIEGLGFFMTLLIVYLLGLMATNMIGREILKRFESLLLRIPLVATIYAGVKQVMDTLRTFNAGMNFKRVVYVPYPCEGSYMLGYVTGVYKTEVNGKEVTNVFLPTAPNPMTGFVILIDSDKVIESDLTMEEASKIILSAGLLTPKRLPAAVVNTAPAAAEVPVAAVDVVPMPVSPPEPRLEPEHESEKRAKSAHPRRRKGTEPPTDASET
jgi:uncharacterized membrane protein